MIGDAETVRGRLDKFAAKGRIVDHLGVEHLAFPTSAPVAG
jgi:hypothetical protein